MLDFVAYVRRWIQWRETQALIAVLIGYMIVLTMIRALYRLLNLGGALLAMYFASNMIRSLGRSKAAPRPILPHPRRPYTMVIMTGASSGIGMDAAARLCATEKIVLVVGVRGKGRAKEVAGEIELMASKLYKNRKGTVEGLELDLLDLESVRRFANESAIRAENHVVLLICNAGIANGKGSLSKDGFDVVFQANFISHYILTQTLLEKANVARVVLVSSCAHLLYRKRVIERSHPLLNGKVVSSRESYALSKCMLIMMAKHLSEKYKVEVVAAHPGLVGTNISRDVSSILSLGWNILVAHAGVDIARGADTILDCALRPCVEAGKLYHGCGIIAECAPCVTDAGSMKVLSEWVESLLREDEKSRTPTRKNSSKMRTTEVDDMMTRATNTPEGLIGH